MAVINNNENSSFYDLVLARRAFDFERNHDSEEFRVWALQQHTNGWIIAISYVIIILAMKRVMRDRPKMSLRLPLTLWNFATAAFSILAAARTLPYMIRMLSKHGAIYTTCDESLYHDEVVAFWGSMFMVSKVPELIDTVFIVLRKQELIFLHFYHHASVVVFVFYSYPTWVGSGLFYMTMNYTVHAFMYTYYMFRAMGVRIPRLVNITITTMQIVQMILACVITAAVYYRMAIQQQPCGSETMFQIHRTFIVYFSYFVLFIHYFVGTYLRPKKSSTKVQKSD